LRKKQSSFVQKLKLSVPSKSCVYSVDHETDSLTIVRRSDGQPMKRSISVAPSEAQLQAQIATYLSVALPPNARFHHSPGEGRRGWKSQADLKSSGFTTGWPDLEIVWQGRVYFLELKSAKGRVSPVQAKCHAGLSAAGAPIGVVRSLDEAVARLKEWGIPLRASL
jgi:hypothetical protein